MQYLTQWLLDTHGTGYYRSLFTLSPIQTFSDSRIIPKPNNTALNYLLSSKKYTGSPSANTNNNCQTEGHAGPSCLIRTVRLKDLKSLNIFKKFNNAPE